jgi:tryptophan-rich sensory protein
MDVPRWSFSVLPVGVAAGLGGLGARDAQHTYARLEKPTWAPPARTFGPVWSVLYLTIGVAGWRLFRSASGRTKALHLAQLSLNAAWPAVFFGVRNKRASLVIIALLDSVLAAEILSLRREDPVAASLLLPYLGWSGFATLLNATVGDPGHGPGHRLGTSEST